ncbi:hypothetical protein BDZ91DRAFT_765778 [Kalaharituber pfeilii]|nr:hypothetical protein BDZ91DRAFT_765778 [Kalaharituber pfeilii]
MAPDPGAPTTTDPAPLRPTLHTPPSSLHHRITKFFFKHVNALRRQQCAVVDDPPSTAPLEPAVTSVEPPVPTSTVSSESPAQPSQEPAPSKQKPHILTTALHTAEETDNITNALLEKVPPSTSKVKPKSRNRTRHKRQWLEAESNATGRATTTGRETVTATEKSQGRVGTRKLTAAVMQAPNCSNPAPALNAVEQIVTSVNSDSSTSICQTLKTISKAEVIVEDRSVIMQSPVHTTATALNSIVQPPGNTQPDGSARAQGACEVQPLLNHKGKVSLEPSIESSKPKRFPCLLHPNDFNDADIDSSFFWVPPEMLHPLPSLAPKLIEHDRSPPTLLQILVAESVPDLDLPQAQTSECIPWTERGMPRPKLNPKAVEFRQFSTLKNIWAWEGEMPAAVLKEDISEAEKEQEGERRCSEGDCIIDPEACAGERICVIPGRRVPASRGNLTTSFASQGAPSPAVTSEHPHQKVESANLGVPDTAPSEALQYAKELRPRSDGADWRNRDGRRTTRDAPANNSRVGNQSLVCSRVRSYQQKRMYNSPQATGGGPRRHRGQSQTKHAAHDRAAQRRESESRNRDRAIEDRLPVWSARLAPNNPPREEGVGTGQVAYHPSQRRDKRGVA